MTSLNIHLFYLEWNRVNTDTLLLLTVFIIPGERKPLLFLNLFNTDIPVNTDTFYGPLSPYKEAWL